MTTPDYLYEVWSPDDVAECMDGVNAVLYARLWSLVPLLPRLTADDETPDCAFKRALVHVWHHLTPVEQAELNLLAEQHWAREDARMAERLSKFDLPTGARNMLTLEVQHIDVIADDARVSVTTHANIEDAHAHAQSCATDGFWLHDFNVSEDDDARVIAILVRS